MLHQFVDIDVHHGSSFGHSPALLLLKPGIHSLFWAYSNVCLAASYMYEHCELTVVSSSIFSKNSTFWSNVNAKVYIW